MFGINKAANTGSQALGSAVELPYQVARLSFDSKDQYDAYRARHPKFFGNVWTWQMRSGNRPEPFTFLGICDICDAVTNFSVNPRETAHGTFKHQVHWWMGAACERCGIVNRDRLLARLLAENAPANPVVHHLGYFSNLRKWLPTRYRQARFGNFMRTTVEQRDANGIQYDDSAKLPFADGSVDILVVVEVLEQVPNLARALAEMARVVKPGGRTLIGIPWVGQEKFENLIRARVRADGTVEHVQPAAYHRDAASGAEFLRFRAFGWQLLEELKSAGFSAASAEFAYAPVHGYVTLHPVIAATR
jgi:SAM-dependent methyltransferase